MYVVLLRFAKNKAMAPSLAKVHMAWIEQGFEDNVFLLTGSLQPKIGGGIVAHNTSLEDLEQRVSIDPFVANNVVSAEIVEIVPARADDRLQFLCS